MGKRSLRGSRPTLTRTSSQGLPRAWQAETSVPKRTPIISTKRRSAQKSLTFTISGRVLELRVSRITCLSWTIRTGGLGKRYRLILSSRDESPTISSASHTDNRARIVRVTRALSGTNLVRKPNNMTSKSATIAELNYLEC